MMTILCPVARSSTTHSVESESRFAWMFASCKESTVPSQSGEPLSTLNKSYRGMGPPRISLAGLLALWSRGCQSQQKLRYENLLKANTNSKGQFQEVEIVVAEEDDALAREFSCIAQVLCAGITRDGEACETRWRRWDRDRSPQSLALPAAFRKRFHLIEEFR